MNKLNQYWKRLSGHLRVVDNSQETDYDKRSRLLGGIYDLPKATNGNDNDYDIWHAHYDRVCKK